MFFHDFHELFTFDAMRTQSNSNLTELGCLWSICAVTKLYKQKFQDSWFGVVVVHHIFAQETHTLCVFDRLPEVSWRRAKYKQMYGLKSTLTVSR